MADRLSGPVWKDHTFFDVDYEGTRVVLPTNPIPVLIPSPQFQQATLSNLLTNGNSTEIPWYQQMFKVFNGAPGTASAKPVSGGGCGSADPTAFGLAAGTPCAEQFTAVAGNEEREYQWAARVDHTFSANDRGYLRVWRDNGYQPTYTDVFSPVFNAFSAQPQMARPSVREPCVRTECCEPVQWLHPFLLRFLRQSNPSTATAALPFPVAFSGNFFGMPQSNNANAVVGGTYGWKITPIQPVITAALRASLIRSPAHPATSISHTIRRCSLIKRTPTPTRRRLCGNQELVIAWKSGMEGKTVIRAGAGVFADELPGYLAQNAAFNAPNIFSPVLSGATSLFAPGLPNSFSTVAASSNAAFRSGFQSGATLASLSSAVAGFAARTSPPPSRAHLVSPLTTSGTSSCSGISERTWCSTLITQVCMASTFRSTTTA